MRLGNCLTSVVVAIAIAVSPANLVNANQFVVNGGFETSTGGNPAGYGQVDYNVTLNGWSVPSGGYTFLYNATNVQIPAANAGAVVGQYGTNSLWGSTNGGLSTITASPDGGNFIAQDSAFQQGAIEQTLTGLIAGQNYAVSFYWAAAQQEGYDGDTYDHWDVTLGGGPTQSTSTFNLASHDFSGWFYESFTFTATGSTQLLSFFADGGPPGVPPFALLDGVSVVGPGAAVPEPSSIALLGLGIVGLGIARHRRRSKAASV